MFVNKRVALRLGVAAGVLGVGVLALGGLAGAQASRAATSGRSADQRIADLEATVKSLQTQVQKQADTEAIYKLTRAYGYYVDKAQWSDVASLWAEKDSWVEIAARGVYVGRDGAERLFKMSMGGGQDGLREGQLFNHMLLQGVVDVDPGGRTAKGRWRAWVQIGSAPMNGRPGSAMWSEGTYENTYVKENGVWMFKTMRFWPTFYTPYDKGWGVQVNPNNGPSRQYPPDRPKTEDGSDVLPHTFVPPYHYPNPVTGKAWVAPPPRTAPAGRGAPAAPAAPAGQPGAPAAPPAR